MRKENMRVAVAYNETAGDTSTDPLDLISEAAVKEEAEDVFAALQELGHSPVMIPIRHLPSDIRQISETSPDIIFNLCEGYRGNASHEMHVTGIWELLGIPYTGNLPLTLGLSQNKVLSKNIFESNHIPTPPYQVFSGIPAQCDLNYPLIAKPSSEDASLGITKDAVIENFGTLAVKVEELLKKYRQPVLVEEFIEGREFNISVLGGDSPDVLPVSEISFAALEEGQPHITSYEAKWLPDHPLFQKTPPVCPAEIDGSLEGRLRETALWVFTLLQGRDYGRVDVRVDSERNIYVLEYNPNPDISAGAGFANAARASGLTYTQTIGHIINQTIKRRK